MIRTLATALFLLATVLVHGQTRVKLTNITINEKDQVRTGEDAMAYLVKAEGNDRVVLYDQNGTTLKTQVRVRTHDSNRSSLKEGAVYLTFELRLSVDGKEDRRTVQKVFYAEQERKTTITEKYTFKQGIDMRVITVKFDATLE